MEMIDPKWVDVGLKALELVAIVVIAAFTWIVTRTKASQMAVDEARKDHQADMADLARLRQRDRSEIESQISGVERALSEQIGALRKEVVERVDTIEIDVRELRTRLELVPGMDDFGKVHERVDDVAQGVATLTGTVNEMNRTLHMIQEHLMRAAK